VSSAGCVPGKVTDEEEEEEEEEEKKKFIG